MQIESDKDFPQLRLHMYKWRKKFPMFSKDVNQIEDIVENHIQNYSRCLVNYRQTRSKYYLEEAQKEIDSINTVVATVEKMELMALLSQR